MEEKYRLIDHPKSFKSQGLKEFSDEIIDFIDLGINRNTSESDFLQQLVSKYKGRKVELVATPASSGNYNYAAITIIDWEEAQLEELPIYELFLNSPHGNDYVPFGYSINDNDQESLYLCDISEIPSPWVRVFNDESTESWAGHYFENSIRNCSIIPFTLPEKYTNRDAKEIVEEIESFLEEGDEAALKAVGLENSDHAKYVLVKTNKCIQAGCDSMKSLFNETVAQLSQQMNENIENATQSGLLDPIKGVSLEDWAAANVKISQGTPLEQVLSILGVEKPVWDEVSAAWLARMSQDTTFAISTVYSNAFVNPNIGKFAQAPASVATANGDVDKVKNDFELYIKIMCHQTAASVQGIDTQSVLKQYGLSIGDWGVINSYWGPKMTTDYELAIKMGSLMEKYNNEFAQDAPVKAGDDIEF